MVELYLTESIAFSEVRVFARARLKDSAAVYLADVSDRLEWANDRRSALAARMAGHRRKSVIHP
jgi:hypothetical protein